MEANIESIRNLEANLREHGLDLRTIPYALQFNKRDTSLGRAGRRDVPDPQLQAGADLRGGGPAGDRSVRYSQGGGEADPDRIAQAVRPHEQEVAESRSQLPQEARRHDERGGARASASTPIRRRSRRSSRICGWRAPTAAPLRTPRRRSTRRRSRRSTPATGRRPKSSSRPSRRPPRPVSSALAPVSSPPRRERGATRAAPTIPTCRPFTRRTAATTTRRCASVATRTVAARTGASPTSPPPRPHSPAIAPAPSSICAAPSSSTERNRAHARRDPDLALAARRPWPRRSSCGLRPAPPGRLGGRHRRRQRPVDAAARPQATRRGR